MTVREVGVNATPIVKPDRPETLASVDVKLRNCAIAAKHYRRSGEAEMLERVMLDADRLLDVRLAISKADNGDLA